MEIIFGLFLLIAIPVAIIAGGYWLLQAGFKLFTGSNSKDYAQRRYNQNKELEFQMQRHNAERLRREGLL